MRRHRLDVLSLLSGLLFAALGLSALFDLDLGDVRWDLVVPGALLLGGVAVLVSAARRRGER